MKVVNKNALFEYTILERFEAGIKLMGAEVKSIRGNRMSLTGSFVRIIGTEAYLVNAQIKCYPYARPEGYDPRRTRKLLLHRTQILTLKHRLDEGGLALVPLSLYTTHGIFKLEIGLARGKKQYEKREAIKKRDAKRELARIFRGKIK